MKLQSKITYIASKIIMKRIGFFDNGIGFRGTTRAIIEYCKVVYSWEEPVEPVFYFCKGLKSNDLSIALYMLSIGIQVKAIERKEELQFEELNFLYHVTSSFGDKNKWLQDLKYTTLMHQVGYQKPEYDHATYFAYTSYWQSYYFSNGEARVLPYIINGSNNVESDRTEARSYYNIPIGSIVLGRHGGKDTWNLRFASEAVRNIVNQREDIYFIFMNTEKFCEHPRVIFQDGSSRDEVVRKYIAACDAMIHARWEGETFGLACAEFLMASKPVITWSESRERNHILIADRSIITYNSYIDLECILRHLTKDYLEYKARQIPVEQLKEYFAAKTVSRKLRGYVYS